MGQALSGPINRRRLLRALLGSTLVLTGFTLAGCLNPKQKPAAPSPSIRIGYLASHTPDYPAPLTAPQADAFRTGLQVLGYIDGENITVDYRFANGDFQLLPQLADDLIELRPRVIVLGDTRALSAARRATSAIPLIMAISSDPVGAGTVASLSRPGGNVTGLTTLAAGTAGKSLEFLHEVMPNASRFGALWNGTGAGAQRQWAAARDAGNQLNLDLASLSLDDHTLLESTFDRIEAERIQGLIVLPDPWMAEQYGRIAGLALERRVPSVGSDREFAQAGGLLAYGPDRLELFRRAATYVDKILKGADPATLPVEQPMRFELIVNLRTASALGLILPASLLLSADTVIQ
jgi:putative ABC transport system substrate-binding protein